MSDKKKMVDFPHYDPEATVPWPPVAGAVPTSGIGRSKEETPAEAKEPFHKTYDPDPTTPDPSQTSAGAPDIRDPATRLGADADLAKLSPNVDLKK